MIRLTSSSSSFSGRHGDESGVVIWQLLACHVGDIIYSPFIIGIDFSVVIRGPEYAARNRGFVGKACGRNQAHASPANGDRQNKDQRYKNVRSWEVYFGKCFLNLESRGQLLKQGELGGKVARRGHWRRRYGSTQMRSNGVANPHVIWWLCSGIYRFTIHHFAVGVRLRF